MAPGLLTRLFGSRGMRHCPKCLIVAVFYFNPATHCHLDGTPLVPTIPTHCECGALRDATARHCSGCGRLTYGQNKLRVV